jgi:hypothetical protein
MAAGAIANMASAVIAAVVIAAVTAAKRRIPSSL